MSVKNICQIQQNVLNWILEFVIKETKFALETLLTSARWADNTIVYICICHVVLLETFILIGCDSATLGHITKKSNCR